MDQVNFFLLVCSVIFVLPHGSLGEVATTWDNEVKQDKELKTAVDRWRCESPNWKGVPNVIKEKHLKCRTTYPWTDGNFNKRYCVRACMLKKTGLINGEGKLNATRIEELGKQMHDKDEKRKTMWIKSFSEFSDSSEKPLDDKNYNNTMKGECYGISEFYERHNMEMKIACQKL